MNKRIIPLLIGLLTLFVLSGCAGWAEEDDGNFMKVCNAKNDGDLTQPCTCSLEKLKTEVNAKDFFALDPKTQMQKIYAASASGQCVQWEGLTKAFEETCQKDKMDENFTDEMMFQFCSCASSKIKGAYQEPMEMLIQTSGMTDQEIGMSVFKDAGASSCFNWDMLETMFQCQETEDPNQKKACDCMVEQAKQDFKTAGELFNAILDSMPETRAEGSEPEIDFMKWTETTGKTCGEKVAKDS